MSNQKTESNNKQIKNKREEETNKIVQEQQQEEEQQTQQIKGDTIATTSTISSTKNEVTISKINDNQKIDKTFFDKRLEITNRYQQQIIKAIKATTDNYNQLQKNILNTYQSAFSKFINNAPDNNKSCNFAVLEQVKVYSKINQSIIDSAINSTRTIHEFLAEYTEIFNKSIELGQEYYYSDEIKNYFKFKRIERI
ncbi:MAG TPA: hypothetical protein VLA74_00705 [Nitrososphaeraceae archaeon]|nr:hypothetical protein [Nitrososphaeraceae archaeon]